MKTLIEQAYELNRTLSMEHYLESLGYKPKKNKSTKKDLVFDTRIGKLLVRVGESTCINLETGKPMNLFDTWYLFEGKIINGSYTKAFVKRFSTNDYDNIEKRRDKKLIPSVFKLSDYRFSKVFNTQIKEYLKFRGLRTSIFSVSLFKDTICPGNKKKILKYENILFPFKDEAGNTITILEQYPVVNSSKNTKYFAKGGSKSKSLWQSNVPPAVETLFVTESPLDAISHFQMFNPSKTMYVATGGNLSKIQLGIILDIIKKNQIKTLKLGFDNDFAGCIFDLTVLDFFYKEKIELERNIKNIKIRITKNTYTAISEKYQKIKDYLKEDNSTENAILMFDSSAVEILKKFTELFCNYQSEKIQIVKSKNKDFNEDLLQNKGIESS